MQCRLLSLLLLALPLAQDKEEPPQPRPVAVFAKLDGTWRGTFVQYDAKGVETLRIAVEQTYETVDANTQVVRMRDGAGKKAVTASGRNTARRRPDGSLELRCIVEKSTGEKVEHEGRLVKGPGGKQELVWFSVAKERSETFREWVEGEGVGARYRIQGMGRYGDSLLLMAGDYERIK